MNPQFEFWRVLFVERTLCSIDRALDSGSHQAECLHTLDVQVQKLICLGFEFDKQTLYR